MGVKVLTQKRTVIITTILFWVTLLPPWGCIQADTVVNIHDCHNIPPEAVPDGIGYHLGLFRIVVQP